MELPTPPPTNEAYLNTNLYSKLIERGIENLSNNNSISKVVKECLHWYGIGLDEKMPSAKLINFVTILEAALKRNGERTELKQKVSDRCAFLLDTTFDSRKKIVKEISKIYDERSKVVHTGTIVDDQNTAVLAGGYARAVLIELIQKNSHLNGNFEKFIDELDDLKYN